MIDIYAEMQEAINLAWATTDPEIKRKQFELTGSTRVPTVAEFVFLVSQKIKQTTEE